MHAKQQWTFNSDRPQHCSARGKPTVDPLERSHLHNVRLIVSCLLQHTLGGVTGLQAVEGAKQPARERLRS